MPDITTEFLTISKCTPTKLQISIHWTYGVSEGRSRSSPTVLVDGTHTVPISDCNIHSSTMHHLQDTNHYVKYFFQRSHWLWRQQAGRCTQLSFHTVHTALCTVSVHGKKS